jgi:membrane-bound lytic murein transglycosylase A
VRAEEATGPNVDPLNAPETQLEPVKWTDLDGWADDDHAAAFATFRITCRPFTRVHRPPPDARPIYAALWTVCRRAAAAGNLAADKKKARAFFETYFRPVRIAKLGEATGLLTGYYEPIVEGSRFPSPEFSAPLYRRPRDLVLAAPQTSGTQAGSPQAAIQQAFSALQAAGQQGSGQQAAKATVFPNRATVGRLNASNELEPYYDRGAIEDGALDGQHLEICWVRTAWDVMTIQIEGSARILLEDGTLLRVNYDAHNGFGYTAVGRILAERNLLQREEITMDRIRRWMIANPDQAKEVRSTNRSYVFFRITGLNDASEAVGAQGVRLTPGRSIAVDKIHVYGTPFFIEADLPIDSERSNTKFRRLMISQDTGSAILGPARADLFWGAGDAAARIAGRIRNQGRFFMLLPRELDMMEVGKKMPLPPRKPATLASVPTRPDAAGSRLAHAGPHDAPIPARPPAAPASRYER